MDAIKNPFSPGAGAPPPELAGREAILEDARIALGRTIAGRHAPSQILLGLRGTGKTVLLNEIRQMANEQGYLTSKVEAPEDKPLADLLYPEMRDILRQLSKIEKARVAANAALSGLRNFASVFKVTLGDVEIGVKPTEGVADSGDIELDLKKMFELIGNAAKAAEKGWALFIDEVHYLKRKELAAIIVSVHEASQVGQPILVVAAGLPQIARLTGDAKSYAERLFKFPPVGALDRASAISAIKNPIEREGAKIQKGALGKLLEITQCYPFFLQEWASQSWNIAKTNTIKAADVEAASNEAFKNLDNGFFKVRIERLTKAEISYVRAMVKLGDGPYKSSAVPKAMKKSSSSVGPIRASIIRKGVIYSPEYGDIDFTVPLFAGFVKRKIK
jgi:hypothetical protein